ncbi:hypothetical protein PIB30_105042 [Stylosanthes scabra]|uniref:Uncharacterized protein n=1 Tax=Stylosanthes scabra TaxID=79078 RepID=A0ABU6RZZ6_9FABA|nr:hypothetical protein [Stylosanthes scabra]
MFYWLHKLLLVTQITPDPRHFNVDSPYCVIPIIKGLIPEEMLWYIWALSAQYDCAIVVPALTMYHLLCDPKQHFGTPLEQLLIMFAPIPLWRGKLYGALDYHGIWNDPYNYEDEPRKRVHPVLPSPTHVDAELTEEEALLSTYEGDEYNLPEYDYSIGYDEEYIDVTIDHEPITKYSP